LDEYTEKYNILDAERNKMKKQMLHLQKQKEKQLSRREFLKDMISEVAGGKLDISFFNESAWIILIQSVKVLKDGKLVFRFQNDVEITVYNAPHWAARLKLSGCLVGLFLRFTVSAPKRQ
ncbi:MAG: hypothetical protein MRZ94_06760, partial [Oscillospiraceae bacterium]|nr:hypothetical protein [Oscillospiraceae bacterium]